MSQYRVIGEFEVAGKRNGELVELDSNEVNIQALIDAGHVERVSERQRQSQPQYQSQPQPETESESETETEPEATKAETGEYL